MRDFKGTGGQILVECLADHGIKQVTTVAGESYLAVLDALLDHPEIEVITCRQEGGAAYMAEARGKLSGKPGICFVTRGPGACNASIGVHTAMQDSTPMILFMGQVARADKGREAFQEIDVPQVFGGLAKWATEITDPARIPEIINRAFKVALSGRPGPVVISLPEDMLTEMATAHIHQPVTPINAAPAKEDIHALQELLRKATNPVILVGGHGWDNHDCEELARFASKSHIPVVASFRRQDLIDHRQKCYVGELGTGPNPALVEKLHHADLWVIVGARLNEITTQGYKLPALNSDKRKIIHIHPDANELGKVYATDLAVTASIKETVAALPNADGRGWAEWRDSLRKLYENWTEINEKNLSKWQGADMTAIFKTLRETMPAGTIITTDAGNFSGWAQRYLQYGRPGRLLAPISGAMGYAVPAAISASLAEPDKTVIGMCGDGGFMMNGQEIATAMKHGAKPIILLCNNGIYGTIRMHQEREYPGRHSATDLHNPDFVMLAQSYGAFAARVDDAKDFADIFNAAKDSGEIAIIEIKMDPRQITTNAKL
ncbi:MAG TPA: thiamine pyrophosphate-binding protein [Micavibrio sp.]|nr:thiamine pyrophosphate-binding protein [Micavibrio sp.]HIL28098.1 thiamine pyrophosphate-binding protein [Micavibrio sp.]